MGSRYDNKEIFKNESETYENLLEKRDISFVRQYGTPEMVVPTVGQIMAFSNMSHIWKVGDRFWKLSMKYYGSSQYWWVIALYNKTPTEAHVRNGDVLTIPLPLEHVLRTIRG
jgi:nucleoid-associated protein YgaU